MGKDNSLIGRAKQSYQSNSVPEFISRCGSYAYRTVSTAISDRFKFPRQHTWELAGTSATFHVESTSEFDSLERTIGPEEQPLKTFIEAATDGDTLFDIGAHLGVYSCFIGNAATMDAIYAFEPHPANVEQLQRNLEINEIEADVVDLALSNEAGATELLLNENTGELEATLVTTEESRQKNTVQIETITGDDFVVEEETGIPDLVKIDVEGEEYEVIDGLASTLMEEDCRLVYCEIHERGGTGDVQSRGHERTDVIERLREFGFEISEVDVYDGGTQILGRK